MLKPQAKLIAAQFRIYLWKNVLKFLVFVRIARPKA